MVPALMDHKDKYGTINVSYILQREVSDALELRGLTQQLLGTYGQLHLNN